MATGGPHDTAVAHLRELLEESAATGGPESVLLLTRLYAHTDRLREADLMARELLEHCEETPPKNRAFLPHLLCQLGAIEGTLGLDDAVEHYEQAILICEQRLKETPSVPQPQILEALAISHDEFGYVLSAHGKYPDATKHCQEAMKCWDELESDESDDSNGSVAQRGRIRTRFHRVSIAKSQGQFTEAISGYEAVIQDIKKDDDFGQDSPELIEPNYLLAECYLAGRHLSKEDLREADKYAREAVRIARVCGDEPGRRIAEYYVALVDFTQGRVSMFANEPDEANRRWDKAAAAWRGLLGEHDTRGSRLWKGRILRRLGDVHYAKDDLDVAKDRYLQAIQTLDRSGVQPIARHNAYLMLARVLHDQGEFQEAEAYLEQAVEITERVAAGTAAAMGRMVFYDQFAETHDLLFECLLKQGKVESAIHCADRFRGRTLRDELASFDIHPLKDLPTAKRDHYTRQLQDELRSLETLYASEREDELSGLQMGRLKELETQLVRTWNEICEANPYYQRLSLPAPQPAEFREQIREIRQHGDMILYYCLGDTASYLCVVTDAGMQRFPLEILPNTADKLFDNPPVSSIPLTRSLASRLVARYVAVLQDSGLSSNLHERSEVVIPSELLDARDNDQPSRGLGQPMPMSDILGPSIRRPSEADGLRLRKTFGHEQAIALTETLLPGEVMDLARGSHKHMIVIAGPALQGLPFQALAVEDNVAKDSPKEGLKYLIDCGLPPICYAPSIGVLALLYSRSDQQKLGSRMLTLGGEIPGDEVGKSLTEAEKECHAFGNHFGHDLSGRLVAPPLTGFRASEGLFRMYAPDCRLIHIALHTAVHTDLSTSIPLFRSKVRPKPSPDDDGRNDGVLWLLEICDLDLRGSEMVILSACSTGKAQSMRLETGKSLARAFLVSGSPRVIATFWDVDDKMPGPLMGELFAQISESFRDNRAIDYASALRNAMNQIRSDPLTASPYHWASFAMIGPPVAKRGWESP